MSRTTGRRRYMSGWSERESLTAGHRTRHVGDFRVSAKESPLAGDPLSCSHEHGLSRELSSALVPKSPFQNGSRLITDQGSGTEARTRHTDWRPTDNNTRSDSLEGVGSISSRPYVDGE